MKAAEKFTPQEARKIERKPERRVPVERIKPEKKEKTKAPADENILAGFKPEERLKIVEQAIADVEEQIKQMESGDAENFGGLRLMRAKVEKGVSTSERLKQREQMRAIMIDNRVAELAAEHSKGPAPEMTDISDDELDNALNF